MISHSDEAIRLQRLRGLVGKMSHRPQPRYNMLAKRQYEFQYISVLWVQVASSFDLCHYLPTSRDSFQETIVISSLSLLFATLKLFQFCMKSKNDLMDNLWDNQQPTAFLVEGPLYNTAQTFKDDQSKWNQRKKRNQMPPMASKSISAFGLHRTLRTLSKGMTLTSIRLVFIFLSRKTSL